MAPTLVEPGHEPGMESLCARLAARALAAWPDFEPDGDGFLARLQDLVACQDLGTSLALELCVEDLYLAHCCARHDTVALRAFDVEVRRELRTALLKFRVPAERHEDVRQDLWEKLFVGAGHPKILEYTGRGRLRTWFRVTVVRSLLDEVRRKKIDASGDVPFDVAAPNADPELLHLQALYNKEFGSAFEQAVMGLRPEERNVLRSYYARSMTIDEISLAFGVHRATAARRVNGAREALLGATRRLLAERLKLDTAGLDSVLRLIESRLHVSVCRILGEERESRGGV